MQNRFHRFPTNALRVFFDLLYHSFAWTYDLVATVVSLGRWNHWVKTTIPYIRGNRVLELGYGPGHLQAELASRGVKIWGVDESRQMNRLAFQRLKRREIQPRLVRGLAQGLPYPAHTFQTVIATFPSEYIFTQPVQSEIRRVLTPDGRLVVLIAAWLMGKSPLEAFMRWTYRLTGQVPGETNLPKILDPFLKAGFNARFEWVITRNSRLLIILADKPDENR